MDTHDIASWALQNLLWKALGSLALAVISTAIAQKALNALPDRKRMLWFFFGVAALFFIALSAIDQLSRPRANLDGMIVSVGWGGELSQTSSSSGKPAPGMALLEESAHIFLICTIVNKGPSPSIAKNWTFKALVNGKTYEGGYTDFPKVLTLDFGKNQTHDYYREDSLPDKALTPIPSGGQVTGLMYFIFPGVGNRLFETNMPIVTLGFEDAYGQKYETSMETKATNGKVRYVPGLSYQR